MSYKHLTLLQRENIRFLYSLKEIPVRVISLYIGCHISTVYREINRNSCAYGYDSITAHEKYRRRRKNCRRKYAIEAKSQLEECIIEMLLKKWSPEQIAGRLARKMEGKPDQVVSTPTIYAFINRFHKKSDLNLKSMLRRYRKRRKKKNPQSKNIFTDRIFIDQRPEFVEKRTEFGHWEGDTIIGAKHQGCLATFVERKSRYVRAFPMKKRKASMMKSVVDKLCLLKP